VVERPTCYGGIDSMSTARTITEEKAVSKEIDNAISKHKRLEDLWEAWKWRLSRDPKTDAICVAETDPLMVIKSDPHNNNYGIPTITILYTFSDEEVNIMAVKINGPTS